ncbi:MAG: FAD-dependent oxidoreductase [Pseudomonadota bacterium]
MPSKDIKSSYDVIVVGSGAAGLTAALTAAHQGLEVLVVEKTSVIGGATARSEGMIWVPCSQQARDEGVDDSPSEALKYLQNVTDAVNPERAQRFVYEAQDMLAFVEANAPVKYELVKGSIDYYDSLPGATLGGRALRPLPADAEHLPLDFQMLRAPLASTMIFGGMTVASRDLPDYYAMLKSPAALWRVTRLFLRYVRDRARGRTRGTRIAGGNALIAGLASGALEAGVTIITDAAVAALREENNRVCGVAVSHAHRDQSIAARKGVVLASGGFSWNPQERAHYYAHPNSTHDHLSLTPDDSAVGSGLQLAESVGGARDETAIQASAWSPVSLLHVGQGKDVPFPHYIDRPKPGVIAVDDTGHRFANEAIPYQDFTAAMIDKLQNRPDARFYLICDHRTIKRYGLGAAPPAPGRLRPFIRNGYLTMAKTLTDLAAAIEVNGAGLEASAEDMTKAAETGKDIAFGKGSTQYERVNGDALAAGPNPCLGPVNDPPFYAVQIKPGDIATFVGISTDGSARVLRPDGEVIQGLYAAGSDMATVAGGAYPAAGITIGPAMTFGWIAGRELAGNSRKSMA